MDTATQVPDEITASRTWPTEDSNLPTTSSTDLASEDDLLVEELRIDDMSIDGMCGVY